MAPAMPHNVSPGFTRYVPAPDQQLRAFPCGSADNAVSFQPLPVERPPRLGGRRTNIILSTLQISQFCQAVLQKHDSCNLMSCRNTPRSDRDHPLAASKLWADAAIENKIKKTKMSARTGRMLPLPLLQLTNTPSCLLSFVQYHKDIFHLNHHIHIRILVLYQLHLSGGVNLPKKKSSFSRWYAYFSGAAALLVTVTILRYPEVAFAASLDGLQIWFDIVLPALLPSSCQKFLWALG